MVQRDVERVIIRSDKLSLPIAPISAGLRSALAGQNSTSCGAATEENSI